MSEPAPTRRRRFRRPLRLALALLGLAVLLVAGDYGYWVLVQHRLVVVDEGRVLQSAEMAPAELVRVGREHAIRSVLDLRDTRPEAIAAEQVALEQAGIKHLHLPSLQEPDSETIERALQLMSDPANQPVLVHCEHGEGRSVLMAALYRVKQHGWSNEAALRASARLPENLRFLADWIPGLGTFRRESTKGRLLLGYRPEGIGDPKSTGNAVKSIPGR